MPQPAAPRSSQACLFRNNRSQAVRIPAEFELPVDTVVISRDGDRLIIEPVRRKDLVALLDSWESLDEDVPTIEDRDPDPEDIL